MAFGGDELVVVAGGGGFIGGHLTAELRRRGHTQIRSVDIKPVEEWFQAFDDVENLELDLRERDACDAAADGAGVIFNLACDMGGMGFIETHKAACMISVLINTHLLLAARDVCASKYFFGSSACVYNADKQSSPDVTPLREGDAYPAMPEDGYGWEKLFSERMCRHFTEDFGLETRVARFHNVYGPNGTYADGREKAPAALCRKVIEAKLGGATEIEIWGDGKQTRSFTFIDDAVTGMLLLMESDLREAVNIGSSQLVTIERLLTIVEELAGIKLERRYDRSAPQGVRGRNSDNSFIQERLGWEPSTSLEHGMAITYEWIYEQIVLERARGGSVAATTTA